MENFDVSRRLLRTRALDAKTHALALAKIDPTWGASVHQLADGWLVLAGKSMYVNRAMAVGIDSELSNSDLGELRSLSMAAGVNAAIEVSSEIRPSVLAQIRTNGFTHDPDRDVSALIRPLPGPDVTAPEDFVVRSVGSLIDLRVWQETSARGWSHTQETARKVSDAYAAAAYEVEPDGMMIAFDRASGAPVGCATVTTRDGLAILGSMTTDPDHRRRGVQAALIRSRLDYAIHRGCDTATTTASVDSASQRNLVRHGFSTVLTIGTWSLDEVSD